MCAPDTVDEVGPRIAEMVAGRKAHDDIRGIPNGTQSQHQAPQRIDKRLVHRFAQPRRIGRSTRFIQLARRAQPCTHRQHARSRTRITRDVAFVGSAFRPCECDHGSKRRHMVKCPSADLP